MSIMLDVLLAEIRRNKMKISQQDLNYLVAKANSLGLKGQFVMGYKLSTETTESIKDTLWFLQHRDSMNLSAADTPPWEKI